MIVVRLYGGLGNQLFQYAVGRALAIKNADELYLDTSWFSKKKPGVTPRKYELSQYRIKAKTLRAPLSMITFWYKIPLIRNIVPNWPLRLYKEKFFGFDPTINELERNVYLDGYWQSYRYFEKIRSDLVNEIQPISPPSKDDLKIVSMLMNIENSVCVHVRRGDYISNPNAAKVHVVCDVGYYERAKRIIESKIENPTYFFFSDDMRWVRTNLNWGRSAIFVEHNSEISAFQDLRLMSMCRHHIIANSTFSWWAAWLAGNAVEQVKIAPKRWLTTQNHDLDYLIPSEWTTL